ncbi:MAG: endopeptidase La [Anaerolineales bacterium]
MNQDDWLDQDEEEFDSPLSQRTEELYRVPNHIPDDKNIIEALALPMRDVIIFPHMVSPVFVDTDAAIATLQTAHDRNQTVIGLTQKDPEMENPKLRDFLPLGVEMAVGRLLSMPDGGSSALVQGRRRVEILEFVRLTPVLKVRARIIIEEPLKADKQTQALMRSALSLFDQVVQLNRSIPEEAHLFALNVSEPGWLADMIATALSLNLEERQELLLMTDPRTRLERVNQLLANEADVLELEENIHNKVQSEVDKSQREFYLREQLKAIQTELGEGDVWTRDVNELRQKVDTASLPEEARAVALKEVERLNQMPPMSPEVAIIRTYIEWILDLPWNVATDDNLDVNNAAQVLDRDHYGLQKAKDRILEFIAVRSLKPKKERQPILCFVGPPGVGKTSLGRSIADALGRKFVRLSLGGVRDEAEIRGHRRTYIGALPGRIIQTMKRAGSTNPLFMLDEIDKLGSDFRGDPSSALLEVLDPEQNHSFSDHYMEIDFDLSKVLFVTTANTLATIPEALLDRLEVIEFPGYIEEEKLAIASRFLLPRQLEENGMDESGLRLTESAVQKVIREYTYEAGVRNLERELGRVVRKVARLKAEKRDYPSLVTPNMVEKFLGPPQFFRSEAERENEVGVATGLAWTESGGEVMAVEVALMEGKGAMQITGQVGEVMQESAQAALTYIKTRAAMFGLDADIFEHLDIHMHLPEGAVPKDGPSAGITLCTALISAFTGRRVYKEVAMTGEITLRGRVLMIGGVREKTLAAHRAGIKTVLMPERNLKDLVELPRRVRADLKIVPITHMDQVVQLALEPEASVEPVRPRKREAEEDAE